MIETIKVTCPDCGNELIVDRKTGKVVEVRRPLVEDSTGDRFEDALLKAKRSEDAAEQKFEEARQREREKMGKLDKLFKEGLKKAKEEKIERPLRDIDLE